MDKKALCSLLIFTAKAVPPFLSAIEAGYQLLETIVGYALIIEIDEYVVIMSRHASGMNSFKKSMIPINGSKLTGSLLSSDSKFTQLRIGNMSLNPNALRNRSYEGNDLNMSLPTFGLNQNQVKSTRLQTTSDESIIVNLSTSRVSKFGEKKKIKELCLWSDKIIGGIKSPFDIDKTFLNNFARPLRWQEKSKKLTPTYILIDIHELRNIISKHEVEIVYGKKDEEKNFDIYLDSFIGNCDKCWELEEILPHQEYYCKKLSNNLSVKVNNLGIKLSCKGRLDKLFFKYPDGRREKFTTFINNNKCFYIGFEEVKYIYYGSQLHEDKNIMDNLDALLSIFEVIPEMSNVNSEKGTPSSVDIDFNQDTVFRVVEDYYKKENAQFIICDDLGNEYADHIVISNNTLSFIHSKAKGHTGLSASNFQDVVGQALKNIGNIRNMDIANKVDSWRDKKYNNSNIELCRKGDINSFEKEYLRISKSPNGIKEICIAIDFIAKEELEDAFGKLKRGESFKQKHSTSQMIWLLSAFVSACKDADLHCRILCRADEKRK